MNRRAFLTTGTVASIAASAFPLESLALSGQAQPQPHSVGAITGLELLGEPYSSQIASPTYSVGPTPASAAPLTPNGLLYYNKGKQAFVSPMSDSLRPTRAKGSYNITSTLRAFNISKDNFHVASQSNKEVQIGLNFTAPITSAGDEFAWIVKSAVNIFMAKQSDRTGALASFQSSSQPTNSMTPTSTPSNKVQVLQGSFDLQVNAFFQKKAGFWRTLFQGLAGVPGSPLLATLGIPGIALDGLKFVAYSFNKLTQNEPLEPLWNPKPLPFALTTGVDRDFNFQEGLWCITDSSVLKSTKLLDSYMIDLTNETYQVINGNGEPLNANYVVVQFDVSTI